MPNAVAKLRDRLHLLTLIARSAAGPRGMIRALKVASVRRGGDAPPEDAVPVPMRALDGEPLYVRPGSSDLVNAVSYYSTGAYLPAPELEDPGLGAICELGTNIGAALAALGTRYPQARLIGLEADPGNAEIAERNLARFDGRAKVVRSAVWSEEADLVIDRGSEHGEHGFLVRPRRPDDPADESVHAITVEQLLEQAAPGVTIDYMHVTIEGSEPQVLGAAEGWAPRVRSLRVELHPYFGFGAADCIALLEGVGYSARVAPSPPDKWVFAVRQ